MYKCRINVHLILINDGHILMIKRANTGFMDGMFSVPAGKLDQGETIHQALVRETKEEVGIDVSLDHTWMKHASILHRFSELGTVALDFFIRLHEFSGKPCNMEPKKCDEVTWVPLKSIPENTVPYVKRAILNSLHGVILDEHIWE